MVVDSLLYTESWLSSDNHSHAQQPSSCGFRSSQRTRAASERTFRKFALSTVPAREHLVTSLHILFICQPPSRAKLGNEALSEPGRLNRMWKPTGTASSAKHRAFLLLPSYRTQDQSRRHPKPTRVTPPISREGKAQVNYPGTSVWRKHTPSQVSAPFGSWWISQETPGRSSVGRELDQQRQMSAKMSISLTFISVSQFPPSSFFLCWPLTRSARKPDHSSAPLKAGWSTVGLGNSALVIGERSPGPLKDKPWTPPISRTDPGTVKPPTSAFMHVHSETFVHSRSETDGEKSTEKTWM